MTPEECIGRALKGVGVPYGHWPYTAKLDGVAIGYRPRADDFGPSAGNRPMRVRVTYDLVVIRTRDALSEAEKARFALYNALRKAGWTLDALGPETYVAEQKRHYWPLSATRGFGVDADGQPYDLTAKEDDKG